MGRLPATEPRGRVTLEVLKVADAGTYRSMAEIARAANTSREMVRQALRRWRPRLYARFVKRS